MGYTDEPGRAKLDPVNKGLDEPDRIIRSDIIIHRFGQQQELRAVRSRQMRHATNIPCAAIYGNPQTGFSHSLHKFCIRRKTAKTGHYCDAQPQIRFGVEGRLE